MKILLTLALLLSFTGAADAASSKPSAQMTPEQFIQLISEGDVGPDKPEVKCPKTGPCFPHYLLDSGIDKKSVQAAINFIHAAVDAEPTAIILEINTPGGDTEAGFKLERAIENAESPILCLVDGSAMSMGFYILQSCDVRVMTARSELMVHEPYFPQIGPATMSVMHNALADLEATAKAMAFQAQHRLNINMKAYLAHIQNGKDWHMAEDEALKVGAVDCVVFGSATDALRQMWATGNLKCSDGNTVFTYAKPEPHQAPSQQDTKGPAWCPTKP